MPTLSANDRISLDDDVDVKVDNLTDDAVRKNLFLAEILSGQANIEVITNCEGCDATLATPVMLVYSTADDGEKQRDSSTLCDANCVE